MIRQIALLLASVVLLAIGGSAAVGVLSARDMLQSQWQVRNGDAATLLALALSQQHGDASLMGLVLSAQFDAGHYRRISMRGADGAVLFERVSPVVTGSAPGWLVAALPISAPAGRAIVSDGWKTVGRIEVESHAAWAYDTLWATLLRGSLWLLVVGIGALVLASLAVDRWREGLDRVVEQAHALERGRFVEIAEPRTAELQRLAAGMNSMVRRLHLLFEGHATQVETLRRQAQLDGLTGLSNRRHFVAQLERALVTRQQDGAPPADAPRRGALLIVRLRELEAMNARVGHDAVDRLLASMGEVLLAYPQHAGGAFAGRLNGGDLALYLPVNGVARETADAIRATLSVALPAVDGAAEACIGAVDRLTTGSASDAMARADEALARAENEGGFAIDVMDATEESPMGEREWRGRIVQALGAGRAQLAEFPVVDAGGRLLQLECPLRLQLGDGDFRPAAQWLPMAARGRLTQKVDLMAVTLALQAISRDGRPRAVHVAAASLLDGGLVADIARLLAEAGPMAAALSLELADAATGGSAWRDAAAQWRDSSVRLGLEHAGGSLHRLVDARGWGLDYLKIDGRFVRGLSHDRSLADYAGQIVAAARSIDVAVYAAAVDDPLDLRKLWELGFDGATGPAVVAEGDTPLS